MTIQCEITLHFERLVFLGSFFRLMWLFIDFDKTLAEFGSLNVLFVRFFQSFHALLCDILIKNFKSKITLVFSFCLLVLLFISSLVLPL